MPPILPKYLRLTMYYMRFCLLSPLYALAIQASSRELLPKRILAVGEQALVQKLLFSNAKNP